MNHAARVFLEAHEWEFNEEYAHVLSGKKLIGCVAGDAGEAGPPAGWFLTWADTEAGEWNLARPFGDPRSYLSFLSRFPSGEWHLLIPEGDLEASRDAGLPPSAETLVWHREPVGAPGKCGPAEVSAPEFVLRFQGDNAYFLRDDSIACLVKAIHLTPHTVEPYVETLPDCRGRGLATALLRAFRDRHRSAGRELIYVTSTDNAASLRVAANAGLQAYQRLARVPWRR